jgi:hypothetical protein
MFHILMFVFVEIIATALAIRMIVGALAPKWRPHWKSGKPMSLMSTLLAASFFTLLGLFIAFPFFPDGVIGAIMGCLLVLNVVSGYFDRKHELKPDENS